MSKQHPRIVDLSETEPNRRRGGDLRTLLTPATVGSTSGFMGLAIIKPGERIVVEGVQKVRAGVKVKPVAVTIEEQGAKPVATTDAGLAEKK